MQWKLSLTELTRAIGLVVEYIVAIDGTRVRFPDGALIFARSTRPKGNAGAMKPLKLPCRTVYPAGRRDCVGEQILTTYLFGRYMLRQPIT